MGDGNRERGESELAQAVAEASQALSGAPIDYDALLDAIGEARLVLIGEASHGTHEFYRERAVLTRRLIETKGFTAVAVEADWPDAYRVNRYVRDAGDDATASEALGDFERFPTWMWRNADVLDFAGWLRDYNSKQKNKSNSAGFYGLDLYSLGRSIQAVLKYLDEVDPEAAQRARYRYSCFEDFGEDPQAYGYAASYGLSQKCETEVLRTLTDLQQQASRYLRGDGRLAEDEQFYAEQNARLVKNAEAYYRSMFDDHVQSWNQRDRHMAETLEALRTHLDSQGRPARVVVWAHNSHLGDARATEMSRRGELNLGQLARERYGAETFLVGFSTYTGTVTAADDWGGDGERKQVRPGLEGSYERLFHQTGQPRFWINLRENNAAVHGLRAARLQRAIGVIYRPETERISHYFRARLPEQFDALIHLDETRAVEPLERSAAWERGEVPETYPSGI